MMEFAIPPTIFSAAAFFKPASTNSPKSKQKSFKNLNTNINHNASLEALTAKPSEPDVELLGFPMIFLRFFPTRMRQSRCHFHILPLQSTFITVPLFRTSITFPASLKHYENNLHTYT